MKHEVGNTVLWGCFFFFAGGLLQVIRVKEKINVVKHP